MYSNRLIIIDILENLPYVDVPRYILLEVVNLMILEVVNLSIRLDGHTAAWARRDKLYKCILFASSDVIMPTLSC